jgi:hypothetical protein
VVGQLGVGGGNNVLVLLLLLLQAKHARMTEEYAKQLERQQALSPAHVCSRGPIGLRVFGSQRTRAWRWPWSLHRTHSLPADGNGSAAQRAESHERKEAAIGAGQR